MEIFDMREFDGHELVVFGHDATTGLRAIIAVHSTARGPAAGGCRMWPYASTAEAVADVSAVPKAPAKPAKPKPVKKKAPVSRKAAELDLSALPAEDISRLDKWICLACVLDVFTRHLGLSAKTAQLEIKRHSPSLQELYAPMVARPYFTAESVKDVCPYCGSPSKCP